MIRKRLNVTFVDDSKGTFRLEEPVDYRRQIGNKVYDITVPAGFIFDGASIPKPARAFLDPTDPDTIEAALLHDFLYATRLLSKAEADKLFYLVMRDSCSWVFSQTYYNAVKFGGHLAYYTGRTESHPNGKVQVTPYECTTS